MDFYSTIIGKQFYQSTMPTIAKSLEALAEKEIIQKAESVQKDMVTKTINEAVSDGWRYIDYIDIGNEWICLVFEKEVA